MIIDYTKYVLTKSKKCKIKSDSLVKSLNKLGIGTRYGHWILDIDDFILFNNEKSEMTETYENNFITQSEKKRLKMISNELSKHITRGWIEISNIGHEGHEYVWYDLIRVDSDGSITQTSFSTGPGLVTNNYNKINTYNPNI